MLLERTIHQLDMGPLPPDQAAEMGSLGYLQWLGGLNGRTGYAQEAARALRMAQPFAESSPAVAVFCGLLAASMRQPLQPAPLSLAARRRRGGAPARRRLRMP